MQYAEKKWAEKCEAWHKEHQSCNLELTHRAVPVESEQSSDVAKTATADLKNQRFATLLFYGAIGAAASLAFFLLLYWSLRTNSNIASLVSNTYDKPLYFWLYVILTFVAIILFGANASIFVYRWRKFGPPKIKKQGASAIGSLVGIAASACPVCGSVLLSAIGITGGLAAFPFGGLELKVLSVGLLALPIWLTKQEMKKMDPVKNKTLEKSADAFSHRASNKVECLPADLSAKALAPAEASAAYSAEVASAAKAGQTGNDGVCPVPQDAFFREGKDSKWLLGALVAIALLIDVGWGMLKTDPALAQFAGLKNTGIVNLKDNKLHNANVAAANNPVFDAVAAKVIPEKGFQSKIALNETILKLVENDVIDRAKFETLYKKNYGSLLPEEIRTIFEEPQRRPILLTRENANIYVNLFWPLGLANYMESNKSSPVNGKSLFNFASTGGWNLGKAKNGGVYFNKLKIVELTPAQEALVTKIAQNSYRPCCNNSTFFQDCNHGSALLGLLQLGAAQGLSEDELWREALAFNSFWFSQQYIHNALYMKVVKGVEWEKVDPKIVMGKDFSSVSGSRNIQAEVAKIPNLIPQHGGRGGGSCGT